MLQGIKLYKLYKFAMIFKSKVIRKKIFAFKKVNNTIINKATIKVLITFYKANISSGIIYLMILIIYILFFNLFIKVQVIIYN